MSSELSLQLLVVFIITLSTGLVPLLRRWSDETLHVFLACGAGVFLGAVFLHLLPEVFELSHGYTVPVAVLVGFLLIFFMEKLLFASGDGSYAHGHFVLSMTALAGLSIHALFDGLALAATSENSTVRTAVFVSVAAHKISEAFTLGALLNLTTLPRRSTILYVILFSLMTPIGGILLAPLFSLTSAATLAPLTGLATGSFLYIATGELLPEAFHSRRNRGLNFLLLLLSASAMGLITVKLHASAGH